MGLDQIKPDLISYIDRLKSQINVDQVLVFGSMAEGKETDQSDVDLLVLSEDFSKFDEDKRSKLLYRNSVGLSFDLHVYGLTQKEYVSASPLTSLGAVRTGKVIRIV